MASSAANADSAQMALDVARKHYSADNYDSAIRFCKKSIALNSTPEALSLLQRIEAAKLASATGATSSATETHPSASTTHARHPTSKTAAAASSSSSSSTPAAAEKREFTPAQAALVKRVKACRVTQYYEILGIEKGCTDNDIKKAYRKVSMIGKLSTNLLG
jgi:DnaJ family protein B protein 12